MHRLSENLKDLLTLINHAEKMGFIHEANEAHESLIKTAQQAQGNAYSYFDTSNIPPAISAILNNLNYKVTQLSNNQQQMAQQMNAKPSTQTNKQNAETQQAILQNGNQNPITPNTVNYIQTPGSNPAPINVDDGEINV